MSLYERQSELCRDSMCMVFGLLLLGMRHLQSNGLKDIKRPVKQDNVKRNN